MYIYIYIHKYTHSSMHAVFANNRCSLALVVTGTFDTRTILILTSQTQRLFSESKVWKTKAVANMFKTLDWLQCCDRVLLAAATSYSSWVISQSCCFGSSWPNAAKLIWCQGKPRPRLNLRLIRPSPSLRRPKGNQKRRSLQPRLPWFKISSKNLSFCILISVFQLQTFLKLKRYQVRTPPTTSLTKETGSRRFNALEGL